MGVPAWLEQVTIDWRDFERASRISRDIVARLADDRAALRRLVLAAARDERLRALAEKHDELHYIVLHDALDRGLRVRLHRFSKGLEDIPHNHRFSFSSALLGGSYVHTLFHLDQAGAGQQRWELDQPAGTSEGVELPHLAVAGLSAALTTVQAAGSSYSLHYSTIHKTAMPDEDAFSVFCRGPAQQACALQLEPDRRTYRWKFGRAYETEQVVADRRMTDREYAAFLDTLEENSII